MTYLKLFVIVSFAIAFVLVYLVTRNYIARKHEWSAYFFMLVCFAGVVSDYVYPENRQYGIALSVK